MKYNILFIEDSEYDIELMLLHMKRKNVEVDYEVVDSAESLKKILHKRNWDIIISDHNMPGFSADKAYKIIKESKIDVPFIVVSGSIKHEKAIELMKMGAKDYVLKDYMNKLPLTVIREVEVYKKKKENEESNKKHLAIFNNISDLVLLCSLKENNKIFKIVDFNPQVLRTLEYSADEIKGMHLCDLILSDKGHIDHLIEKTLDGNTTRDRFEIKGKNRNIYGDLGLSLLKYDDERYVIVTIRDISEQEKIERALIDSKKRFEGIFHNTSIGIFVTDEKGKIVNVNNALLKIINLPMEELVNKNADEVNLFGTSRIFKQIFKEIENRDDKEITFEEKISSPRLENAIYVRYNSSIYYSRSDEMKYVISTLEDITEVTKTKIELEKAIHTINKSFNSLINVLGKIIEERDRYTAGHQMRVAMLAGEIAKEMNLSKKEIEEIEIAGRIHDIGMIKIPSEILTKPGKITDIEYQMIMTHPTIAYEILKESEMPKHIWEAVYEHHERIDGSGYPRGLKDGEITAGALILAVADVVDAMTSHKPYRPALSLDQAFEELRTFSGEKYDTNVVNACMKVFKKGFNFSGKNL